MPAAAVWPREVGRAMARREKRAEVRLVKRPEGWLPRLRSETPTARQAIPSRRTRCAASVSRCGAGWQASILSRLGCRRTGLIIIRIGTEMLTRSGCRLVEEKADLA